MNADLIDVNVYLSRWPTRRVYGDEPRELTDSLRRLGVVDAWAGSYDALLHKDIAAVNARTAEACAASEGFLRPVGAVNPALPDWEEDLRRCAEDLGMMALRLHPNYHGYGLDDSRFAALLAAAADRNLLVQIAVTMEDERMMHPLLRVPHVDCAPLPDAVRAVPEARVMLLGAFRAVVGETMTRLVAAERVWFDISWLEGVAGIERVAKQMPLDRLVFGSHAPLFYPESAALKLSESALSEGDRAGIERTNAERALGR